MNTQNLSNEDLIDVRDLMERVDELRSEREDFEGDGYLAGQPDWDTANPDDAEELAALEAILADLAGNGGDEQWEGDWYPVTLIRDSYFTDYAQELVSDIGDLPANVPSYIEIDWEATARNIRMDYTSTEIDGVTYWYR